MRGDADRDGRGASWVGDCGRRQGLQEAEGSSTGPLEGARPCSPPGFRVLASRDVGAVTVWQDAKVVTSVAAPGSLQQSSCMGAGKAHSHGRVLSTSLPPTPVLSSLTHVSMHSHAGMYDTRAHT